MSFMAESLVSNMVKRIRKTPEQAPGFEMTDKRFNSSDLLVAQLL